MSVEASSDFSAAVPSSSFGPHRQIDAGLLNVGYVDIGHAEGPVVVLLRWPYDIHSYIEVSPGFTEAGYRVIVPYLRGFGTTRFLSDETFRNGEQTVLAVDVIALMDALEIEQLWPASIGERALPTSSPPFGQNAATSTGPPRTDVPMPRNSRARTRIESSKASDTMCPKKPRARSPTPSSKSEVDCREFLQQSPQRGLIARRGSPPWFRRGSRLAQLAPAQRGGFAGAGRSRRLLDLYLHQLAPHTRLCTRVGREIPGSGVGRGRRPHSRVPV